MRTYKALGCDSGEVGPPTKKLQLVRKMSLEASPVPLFQCAGAPCGRKPQSHRVRLMAGEALGVGDRHS